MTAGRARAGAVAVLLLLGLAASPVPEADAQGRGPAEDEGADWRLRADSTLRFDQYEVSGPRGASPYPFLGGKTSGEVNLTWERYLSAYRYLRAQALVLATDSEYRSPHEGLVPQRLSFTVQDGEARLPYRLEVGDSFGYFSYRTLQRTLKGVALEVQSPAGARRRHSLQFVSGVFATSYRGIEIDDDFSGGVSWLVDDPRLGTWSVNFVSNLRSRPELLGDGDRLEQRVASVAASKRLRFGTESLLLEGEAGYLDGDPLRSLGDGGGGGEALFLQATGYGRSPFTYRLRAESYGQDYGPVGSPIVADRRSGEAHLGYRLRSGVDLRGRYQFYRDFRETPNPADTQVAGLIVSGPLLRGLLPGVATFLELYTTDVENRDGSLDHRTTTFTFDGYRAGAFGWSPHLQLFLQERDDRRAGADDANTRQVRVSLDRSLDWRGVRGFLSPGVLVRRLRDTDGSSDDWTPTLDLHLARGGHSFRGSLSWLRQDRIAPAEIDTEDLSLNLLYRWTRARWEVGAELDTLLHEPDPGERTDSLRAGVFLTHHLDVGPRAGGLPARLGPDPLATASVPGDRLDVARLAPGTDVEALVARLRQAGLGEPVRVGSVLVYDVALMPEIDTRQRLALVSRDGSLATAALVIGFDRSRGADELVREHDRILQLLVARYGRPGSTYEQGVAGPGVLDDIESGAFIRLAEWVVPGGIMRFGIPRRLDRQVRFELQVSEDFPPVRDTLWSIEEVR